MTSAYFIITYLIYLFFICFGISIISVYIQTGTITNLNVISLYVLEVTYLYSKYSLNFDNKCFISSVKFYINVRIILYSISHKTIIICCYGFYFDLIVYLN